MQLAPRPVLPPSPAGDEPEIRLGISACLLGEEVRYNGGHKRDGFLVQTLGQYVAWYPVCPEVEIGLGVPRETIRLVGGTARPRLLAPASGLDHTATMEGWSERAAEEIASWGLHGFVLKKSSPTCGLFRVKVYQDSGIPLAEGRGVFSRILAERLPLLPLEEEGRLHDPGLRESFIDRVYSYARWCTLLEEDPTPGGLVRFHTAHKLSILSHDPKRYRELGRLVAEAGSLPWDELRDRYARLLAEALQVQATRGKHTNVLQHVAGFVKHELDRADKAELSQAIEDYRQGLLPLVVPLTLLRHHLRRYAAPSWVQEQVYLHPYPRELMLRNHV